MRRAALDIQGTYHGLGEIQGRGVAPHVRRAHLQGEGSVSQEGGGPHSMAGTPWACAGCSWTGPPEALCSPSWEGPQGVPVPQGGGAIGTA